MAHEFESEIFKVLEKCRLFSLDQGIQGARFPTEGVDNNVGFPGMVMNPDVIILD